MSQKKTLLVKVLSWIATVVLALVAWPFAIPAIILALLKRQYYPRYVASGISLLIVVALRAATGTWIFRLGESSTGSTVVELISAIPSWAIGSTLMALSYSAAVLAFRRNSLEPSSSSRNTVEI